MLAKWLKRSSALTCSRSKDYLAHHITIHQNHHHNQLYHSEKKANDDHQDSIIVFTTDNGGPAAGFDLNHASNWPLKGVRPDHITMRINFFSEERKSKKSERRSKTHYGKEE